jgi:hypothetical protein
LSVYKEGDEAAVRRQAEKRYRKIERSFESIIDFPPGDVKNAVCKFSFPAEEEITSSEEDEIVSSFVESITLKDRRKMIKKENRNIASESEDDSGSLTTGSTKAETLETISYAGSNLSR